MTTRSRHDLDLHEQYIAPQVITQSGGAIVGGNCDTKGFDSVLFNVQYGDIDELGGSPVGSAKLAVLIETAPDNAGSPGAYAAASQDEVDGQTVTAGVFEVTTDLVNSTFAVITKNRFVRITLTPTGLTNGGPVAVATAKGHAHLTPVTNT